MFRGDAASSYEIYEWAVDHWLGQHLFIGETDTITDLAAVRDAGDPGRGPPG